MPGLSSSPILDTSGRRLVRLAKNAVTEGSVPPDACGGASIASRAGYRRMGHHLPVPPF